MVRADVDALDEADLAPAPDDDLAATAADVDQDVYVLLVFASPDEAFLRAVERARLDVERLDNRAGAMQLLEQAVDVIVRRRQHDYFLPHVDPLPHLAGGQDLNVRFVGVERKDVLRFELHRRRQLVLRDQRHAQVLDVQHLARQRDDDAAADETPVAEHLPHQVGDGGVAFSRLSRTSAGMTWRAHATTASVCPTVSTCIILMLS
jgi:hypothetical protein